MSNKIKATIRLECLVNKKSIRNLITTFGVKNISVKHLVNAMYKDQKILLTNIESQEYSIIIDAVGIIDIDSFINIEEAIL